MKITRQNYLNFLKLQGFAVLLIFVITSCDRKEENPSEIVMEEVGTDSVEIPAKRTYTMEIQDQWEDYYESKIAGFSKDNFKKDESFRIERAKGTVTPVWNDKFNPVYKDFFAWNADSTQYVDFDSYKWGFDDKGELVINPDQEIVLVNIPEKKVERLLFYGPSFWVEDAYFKNDSVVVLLENSTDRVPAFQEINLNQNYSQYYIYNKPLNFDSEYYKNRIEQIYTEMP